MAAWTVVRECSRGYMDRGGNAALASWTVVQRCNRNYMDRSPLRPWSRSTAVATWTVVRECSRGYLDRGPEMCTCPHGPAARVSKKINEATHCLPKTPSTAPGVSPDVRRGSAAVITGMRDSASKLTSPTGCDENLLQLHSTTAMGTPCNSNGFRSYVTVVLGCRVPHAVT